MILTDSGAVLEWAKVIVPGGVTLFGMVLLDRRSKSRAESTQKKVEAMDAKVEVVHKATNSLVEKLVVAEKSVSHAEGVAEGKIAGPG